MVVSQFRERRADVVLVQVDQMLTPGRNICRLLEVNRIRKAGGIETGPGRVSTALESEAETTAENEATVGGA